jgi:hypothetical protein
VTEAAKISRAGLHRFFTANQIGHETAGDKGRALPATNRILIVRYPNDPFDRASYVIHALSEHWKAGGIGVDVTDKPIEPTGPNVLIFPHLDLTVTPPDYQAFFDRCAKVVNRKVCDISKRRISRNLVNSRRVYDGPVIVKTNRNAGGQPETSQAWNAGGMRFRFAKAAKRLPWTISARVGPEGYQIYDHPRQVPRIVWHNPRLVVEKFLPEREGAFYCLRQYVFLGPCEFNTRALSPEPLVKARSVIRREVLDETPPQVREIRQQLGFDYGKFDYVLRDGQAIVFDTNRTPSYNTQSKAGSAMSLIERLVPGIDSFLET